jgi:uncharacterized protein YdeI (YjbR/CyaY-like superfamily)
MNPKVDFYFSANEKWQKEIELMRTIALDCGLNEVLKWGCPCYSLEERNIVLIHVFKEYCAFLFFKGALMADPNGILIQQTENVQAARQVRFTNVKEIVKLKATLKAYIFEAIEVEKSGLKVTLKKTSEYKVPEEFKNKLDENPSLNAAFKALTPGRQKGYLYYFSQPKLAKTREARIEKSMQQIMEGKGYDE